MTAQERRAFDNGIWMCRHHARLIDADKDNYSAETLRQWKRIAEAETYRQLRELSKTAVPEPSTIICLHPQLMFEGIWAGAVGDTWRFTVKSFIYGDLNALRGFQVARKGERKDYIIVESQGDGRLIRDTFEWQQKADTIEFSVKVFPSVIRRNPNFIGTAPAMGGDILKDGRWRLISGKELAIQKIGMLLNTNQGTTFMNRGYGTLFGFYYHGHRDDPALLNRLIKVELTRLIAIPTNPEQPAGQPELNFINRIHEVRVSQEADQKVEVWLSLEWGDGTAWEGTVTVYIGDSKPAAPPEPAGKVKFVGGSPAQPPLAQFKALTEAMTGDELTVKKNERSVLEIFKVALPAIMDQVTAILEAEVFPLFNDHKFYRTFDHSTFEYLTSYDLEAHLLKGGLIHEMGIMLSLKGFKKAGIKAFDVTTDLFIYFNDYNYVIGASQANPWLTSLYDRLPSAADTGVIANAFIDNVLRKTNEHILAIR